MQQYDRRTDLLLTQFQKKYFSLLFSLPYVMPHYSYENMTHFLNLRISIFRSSVVQQCSRTKVDVLSIDKYFEPMVKVLAWIGVVG